MYDGIVINNNMMKSFEIMRNVQSQYEQVFKNSYVDDMNRLSNMIKSIIPKQQLIDNTGYKMLISDIAKNSSRLYDSLGLAAFDSISNWYSSQYAQWDAIAKAMSVYQTSQIVELTQSIYSLGVGESISNFAKSLGTYTEASNVAYLRSIRTLTNEIINVFPKGLKSILKAMDMQTAKRMSKSNIIELDMNERQFFDVHNTESKANVEQLNVICSSIEVLEEIEEGALIDFMNCLATEIEFASEHKVAKIINETIADWKGKIGFDREIYYHARARMPEDCPFTEQQMGKAPYGITCAGRYSHAGDSHYYFSDKKDGAKAEISKHGAHDKIIQIATIKPVRRIEMIDLSDVADRNNKFLKYIRYAPRDFTTQILREYLIPCFVATCCKRHGIQGIKYDGSKEYKNYVSWDDGYFECIRIEDV